MQKLINLYWYKRDNNFGDVVNPYLIPKLFNVNLNWVPPASNVPHVLAIGSIIQSANRSSSVWGSGFISSTSRPVYPSKVYAVRGPDTRDKLIKAGVQVPEIYGDPALLLPRVYSPSIDKKYKIGIIPHYVDKKSEIIRLCSNMDDVKIIDVQQKNIESIIDDILSCEIVLSSSLHGLIVADAYNIPNIWIRISNGVIGGNFKFNDYFKSVGRHVREPIMFTPNSNVFEIVKNYSKETITFNADPLMKSNPFV